MEKQLSKEQSAQLQELLQKIKANPAVAGSIPSFSDLWPLLEDSEAQLIDLMSTPPTPTTNTSPGGEAEMGLWLYQLNNLGTYSYWHPERYIYEILVLMGMKSSNITSTMYAAYEKTLDSGPGVVAGDGTYLSTVTYGAFDTGWDTAAQTYILLLFNELLVGLSGDWSTLIQVLSILLNFPTLVPFVTSNNKVIQIPSADSLTLAVFGDWGTGQPVAAQVLSAMQSLNPDIYMHLGDVYYAGTSAEESNNLLAPLHNMSNVPASTKFFTLNSNHEMYDGAVGYYGTALSDPLFSSQDGASYFAMEFGNWVLLGLDSAYFDTQSFSNLDAYLNGALIAEGTTTNPQVAFVNGLDLSGKQVLVFTHHNGISLDGNTANQPLLSQLNTILGRYPDFWYYGHIHNGVVYTDPPAITGLNIPSSQITPQLRCCGHAALPYGVPSWLNYPSTPSYIPYFAQTNAGNNNTQLSNTIRNGFALLTLSQNQIVETFYEVDINSGNPVQMWTNTTNY